MGNSDANLDLPRRFYKAVTVDATDTGYRVGLDGRSPRSPSGKPLVLPTVSLARLCAEEWSAQIDHIRMAAMPATRMAYTVLDRIEAARGETAEEIARYAGSDALCYRADYPAELAREQAQKWDPILDWARDILGLELKTATGILHLTQPDATLDRVRTLTAQMDDFSLAGVTHATALFGSAVLALALWQGHLSGTQAFELSRLEEAFQQRYWGVDEEAAARTALHAKEADLAASWLAGCRDRV